MEPRKVFEMWGGAGCVWNEKVGGPRGAWVFGYGYWIFGSANAVEDVNMIIFNEWNMGSLLFPLMLSSNVVSELEPSISPAIHALAPGADIGKVLVLRISVAFEM